MNLNGMLEFFFFFFKVFLRSATKTYIILEIQQLSQQFKIHRHFVLEKNKKNDYIIFFYTDFTIFLAWDMFLEIKMTTW